MGVQGLWELLAPVGRRVSVDTLAGRRLAIDASIWMVQFMKAMRDEKGEMVHNAHLIGFFRRICKLLYLRTKPVFVFDGGTPALKRRTVIARRRQRENAQAKIRKTAEKLLMKQLEGMRVKELAKNLENQRRQQKSDAKGKKPLSDEPIQAELGNNSQPSDSELNTRNTEKLDETLVAPTRAEKDGRFVQEQNIGEDEDLVLRKDAKDKEFVSDDSNGDSAMSSGGDKDNLVGVKGVQDKLDEMLAASIAAEEGGNLSNNPSTSGACLLNEEEDDDDEKMLLPEMHGNVDLAVLASVPPSMQLELLVQMRERLMAENRQKYQKVKKAPEKFSELQIQAYLKTVAFRREIDEVQKSATGRGVGGVQTSRIASEANREFIFSSSFAGDKLMLKSARAEGNGDKKKHLASKHPITESVKTVASVSKADAASNLHLDEPRDPDDDIEVYMDERGRFRIRNRHMGIRMTRDIQRNLSLMKEKERATPSETGNLGFMSSKESDSWKDFFGKDHFVETADKSAKLSGPDEQSMLEKRMNLEISFDDGDDVMNIDEDDDIFTELASGIPLPFSSAENKAENQSTSCGSDSDWEEVPIEKSNGCNNYTNSDLKLISREGCSGDESEVEWQETPSTDPGGSAKDKLGRKVLKSHLEEEASIQEAIRRSLLDLDDKKYESYETLVPKKFEDVISEEYNTEGVNWSREQATKKDALVDTVKELDAFCGASISESSGYLEGQPKNVVVHNIDDESGSMERPGAINPSSCLEQPVQYSSEEGHFNINRQQKELVANSQAEGGLLLSEKSLDVSNDDSGPPKPSKRLNCDISQHEHLGYHESSILHIVTGTKNDSVAEPIALVHTRKVVNETEPSVVFDDKSKGLELEVQHLAAGKSDLPKPQEETPKKRSSYDVNEKKIRITESSRENDFGGGEQMVENLGLEDNASVQVDYTNADLEEEILKIDQEYMSLGDEQRRLERNAESVSSEMFAECQELLQIFGLPYIIAPMEAEAQCAYMELSKLVDGVVTDDSDVFLFGARSVYKNIFDDRKYVETYFMKDIEKELGLNREKLIRMALLLGSDYTEGVSGIGIVNAIEVVNAFPEEDGLQKFREWVESPDPSILGKTDGKAGSSTQKKRGSIVADESQASTEDMQGTKQIFMDKHRNVSKNWHIPALFPSEAVITAYTTPQVDRSTEPFSWGKPDLLVLRKLCWEKFGWNSQKTDDLLLPVLKEYEKRETQLRLEAFYTFSERFAKIRSRRIKQAVKGIAGSQSSEQIDDVVKEDKHSRKKRKGKPLGSEDDRSGSDLGRPTGSRDQNNTIKMPAPKPSRKRRLPEKPFPPQPEDQEPSSPARNKQKSSRISEGKKGDRGRKSHGSGKELRGKHGIELPKPSSADDGSGNELHGKASERPQQVRRSKRSRNPVNYQLSDSEDGATAEVMSNKESQGKKSEELDTVATVEGQEDAFFGFGIREKEKATDPLLKEDLIEGYLQAGGGFCMDEADEIGEPSVQEDVDPGHGNRSLEDHLIMGGGFCANENENSDDFSSDTGFVNKAGDEVVPCDSISAPERGQNGRQKHQGTGVSNSEPNLENPKEVDCPNINTPLQKNIVSDGGNSAGGGLSAMPFLKRKRRKS